MKKAFYLPSQTPAIVLDTIGDSHVKIFINGDEKIVPFVDIQEDTMAQVSSEKEINRHILSSIVHQGVSDLLYSFRNNHLVPEQHQYKPLIKMLNSPNNRLLIADEVGLGKTIEAGMILKEIGNREELEIVIIVVPSSLTLKWKEEMMVRFDEKFDIYKTNEFKYFLNEYVNKNNSKNFSRRIIISYHSLRNESVIERLETSPLNIDLLIMDESHSFRNSDTSTFASAALITGLAQHIVFLSATPVQNNISDLFNQLSLLDEESYMDFDHFLRSIKPNRLIHLVIAGLKNNLSTKKLQALIIESGYEQLQLEEHQKSLFYNFLQETDLSTEERVEYIHQFSNADNLSTIVSRTKKKDVGRLIPREATSHRIEGTPEENSYYGAVVAFVIKAFEYVKPTAPKGFITIMPERMASSCMIASYHSFIKMRKVGKMLFQDIDDSDDEYRDEEIEEELLEMLDQIIEKGHKIGLHDSKYLAFEKTVLEIKEQNIQQMIVFSFFKGTLSYLQERLTEKGMRVGKIDGSLKPEERYSVINRFRKGEYDILLSSEVGSEGLDMQFCNVVINYDLPWNPMRVEQRIGRIDRIGQKATKLLIFNLCIKGSIEDKIISRLYSKLDIFESSIGELEPILGDIQTQFNIAQMIKLSDQEIERKVDLEAQALIRQKKELAEHSLELDALLEESYKPVNEENDLIKDEKQIFLQQSVHDLVLHYLEESNISPAKLSNNTFRLNSEQSKRLFELLKPKVLEYKGSTYYPSLKTTLSNLKASDNFLFTFTPPSEQNFECELISLGHPLVKLMTPKQQGTKFGCLKYPSLNHGGYAVVYREEVKGHKIDVKMRVMLFDKEKNVMDEIDYYSFFNHVESSNENCNVDLLVASQNHFEPHIIASVENRRIKFESEVYQSINRKIDALKAHYVKQRSKVNKQREKVDNLQIIRMKQRQFENLEEMERDKINMLESQKQVTASFQVLAVMELIA